MRGDMSAVQSSLAGLKEWAAEKAYPLWWNKGADQEKGGFHEKLGMDGNPVLLPKRARVLPRQIYSFAQSRKLGWKGDMEAVVRHGLDFYLAHYFKPDGLVRTLVAPDGAPLDETSAFYDQAFALFGLHSAQEALDVSFADKARALMARWAETRKHPVIGFEEASPRVEPLCSNPHMHLFEACLAWNEADPNGPWRAYADEIAKLSLTYFIDSRTGALREFFDGNWQPMPGEQGRIVEPGHQFEWSWLLMRWGKLAGEEKATRAALRLIEIGETFGTDQRGVAFNSLFDDFTPHDKRARLWPQTERLKAHCLAAEVTGKAEHWDKAAEAARGLEKYFATPIPGLWRDMMSPEGGFTEEAAPASSFYHIICAIVEFDRAVSQSYR
jgi:mannose/cellobiose epimerase-like protein (N-acyl-D-glucosamine 2-epimerase family)